MIQPVLSGERVPAHSCSGALAYLQHLLGGQFGEVCSLTPLAASLGNHVRHVGLMVTEEEMVGSHTKGRVAVMQYPQASGNTTEGQFPGNAVRQGRGASPATGLEAPIATGELRATPQPATVRPFYLRPEALSERLASVNSPWHRGPTPFGVQAPGRLHVAGALAFPLYLSQEVFSMPISVVRGYA